MDFFGKINAKNNFGMFENNQNNNIINIICGVLLIILIIVLIICLCRKKDGFSNPKKYAENDENDKDDTHIYQVVNNLDPTKDFCPHSRRMSELLAKNNNMLGGSKVKKITMEDPRAKGVTGTPTIICTKSGLQSVGFKPLDKVSEDLKLNNNNNNNDSNNNSSGKDILLIGSMSCPFCGKAKQLMDELQIDYHFVDSQLDLGKQHMLKSNSNGVPLIYTPNGYIKGFNEQEIRSLKN